MSILGSLVSVEIIDIGHKGEAIGKIDGLTVFVEGGSVIGDVVEAKITKIKSNYIVAKVQSITKKSKLRVDSLCKASNLCGGCQLIDMDYKEQLKLKEKQVNNIIKRIGKIDNFKSLPIIGMEEPFFYRNKSQLPIGLSNDKVQVGFYELRSHNIINIDKCVIQDKSNENVIVAIKEFLEDNKNEIYNEITGEGNIRRIITKIAFNTNELMVIIVTKNNKLKNKEILIDILKSKLTNLKTIVQNINPTINNAVMGRENIILYGDGKINEYLEDLVFEISPHSFFQINPKQTVKMYNIALEFADITDKSTVIDLYCGLGSISLFIARKAKFVYAIEVVQEAIEDAKRNAKLNNMEDKTQFICGKSEDILPELYKDGVKADVIILDPPRKGCEAVVLETISKMNSNKIVYVSCNPATLSRDIEILTQYGYRLEKIQAIDNFCHSMHVECVCLLTRNK
ncbi:MAG: 23S rRNA (uracil(1939)-C(5))-methyltransferase RlmD [Filifactoraceae bacterium]